MTGKLQLFLLACILASCLLLAVQADPEPEPAKVHPKYHVAVSNDNEFLAEARQAAELVDVNSDEEDEAADSTPSKDGASSGRLFMKKFLLFRNMFSNSNSQPVIPIIITGTNNGNNNNNNPTTTVTSTGTIPTATGTITTSPATRRSSEDEDEQDNLPAINEQALHAALAAGAQEYVVTDDEIKGTSDGKASKQPANINLKRKGAKKGQIISVRIPPRYRQYFSNGQKVMLNTNNRPSKRRVVKKRVNNKNRRRVNKNKRRRVVPVA